MFFLDFELSQSHGKGRNRAKVMEQIQSHGFYCFRTTTEQWKPPIW